jgi:hypothetical protein
MGRDAVGGRRGGKMGWMHLGVGEGKKKDVVEWVRKYYLFSHTLTHKRMHAHKIKQMST